MQEAHRIVVASTLASLLGAVPLGSALAATQVLTYKVEHPKYGDIGTYINTISEDGTSADVRTDLHVAVKLIGIPLFHQDATREEHWKNQRLVSFQSATDDNGTEITVRGAADGNGFDIQSSSNGNLVAPPQVHPSNPWAPFVLHTDMMMSTKTGKVSPVVVKDTGIVTMTIDGQPMRVHQWFVDDDKHQVVWVDDRGIVVAFQTEEQGAPIDFILERATASNGSPGPTLANN